MTTTRSNTVNKQAVAKKLMAALKKRYKTPLPKTDRPILELMLYSICLENATDEEAEEAYKRLGTLFHDLNEARVSSISELAAVFNGANAEQKALRIRSTLQHVFEKHYAFDFETLRRSTLELAGKQLAKFKDLSPFVRSYTLQFALGGHLVPVDDAMTAAAVWLGLVHVHVGAADAATELKSAVRKSDAVLFCHLLRCLAQDPVVKRTLERAASRAPENGYDLATASERLEELFRTAGKANRARHKRLSAPGGKKALIAKRTASSALPRKKTSLGKRTKKVAKKTAASNSGRKTTSRRKK